MWEKEGSGGLAGRGKQPVQGLRVTASSGKSWEMGIEGPWEVTAHETGNMGRVPIA